MPVVFVFPSGQNIEGDDTQIFVVDKAEVDVAYDDSNKEYIKAIGPEVVTQYPAMFEQILEQHLLEVTERWTIR